MQFLLNGELPSITVEEADRYSSNLIEYAITNWTVKPSIDRENIHFSIVLEDNLGQQVGILVIHPLQSRPSEEERTEILAKTGIRCIVHTSFDLERRPFWVLNNLI